MASFPSTGGLSTPNGINPLTYPLPGGSRKVSALSSSGPLSPTRRRSHLRATADARARSPEKQLRKALTAGVRTLPKIERGESGVRGNGKRSPSKERGAQ